MLLSEEKPGSVRPEFPRSDQPVDRAIPFGHMQPCWFIIFIGGHAVQAKRQEPSHDGSLRVLPVQFVCPDRVECIQLIVQRIAAIFGYEDGVSIIDEGDVIKRIVLSVAKHHQGNGPAVSVGVEIDAEDSAPGAARRQYGICAGGIVGVARDVKEERAKM